MENNKLEPFSYNPKALDICKFNLIVDHEQWRRFCKAAADFNSDPDLLHAVLLEHFLIKIGYLDPKSVVPGGKIDIEVTLRDIRENPANLYGNGAVGNDDITEEDIFS